MAAPYPFARRFPPPWTTDEHNNACFIVKDATGQALAYFYFEDEPIPRLLPRGGRSMIDHCDSGAGMRFGGLSATALGIVVAACAGGSPRQVQSSILCAHT